MARIDSEHSYEVFARHGQEPALRHIGQVQADTKSDALVFAYTLYDERKWQDMFVAPTDELVQLVRPE
jgi:1,2-phenylacetyl-CoA epoxidase PaaB subunit